MTRRPNNAAQERRVTIAKREDQTRPRILAWDGCLNARDLGGYLTNDGLVTRWGAIVRSDSLAALSRSGQDALRDYGICTIIDLRLPTEVEEAPNPFAMPGNHGITYIHESFITVPREPDEPFSNLTNEYVSELGRHGSSIAKIMALVANARNGGVLIHCVGGRDRTGLIAALLLSLVGVPLETVAEDYALSSECLRPRDEDFLVNGPGRREERERLLVQMKTQPEIMRETLTRLTESYGGVMDYLNRIGCTHEDLARLQIRLIGQSSLTSVT
jgi:protein-tyrosine phosphatase